MIKWIKEFRQWRLERHNDAYYERAMSVLLSLELDNYSKESCLLAAGKVKGLRHKDVGYLANLLYQRCGRGRTTLTWAVAQLETELEYISF